jgi:predicted KAP-like P-loop ATPase
MKSPLFYSDAAIRSAAQDHLDRKGFARQLAERLAGWNSDESLVLGLYGPWGSGKSSIKNMALEHLRRHSDSCPHIVEFNPWQISGQDQLTEAFFHEIAVGLQTTAGGDPNAAKRAEKWASYGRLLTIGGTVATSLKAILPLVGVPGGPLVGLAAEALKSSGELATQGEKAARSQTKTLQEAKEQLRRNFKRTLKKPVLIVVDDIDRLTFEEIRLLFRLVKANADFPRFIFLLLFQKSNVAKALDPVCDNQGAEYLEKIVQVGYDVPELKRQALNNILVSGVNGIMASLRIEKKFDEERWYNLFIPDLQPYFRTLRDVYRFLNVFSFSISSLSGGDILEVNPVDLIATEALRVFENESFRRIAASKELLTAHHRGDTAERKGVREAIEALAADARHKERVQDVITKLFPNLGGVLGAMNYDQSWSSKWRRDLRLCHPANFDRYFFLTVADGDISERDLQALIADVQDRLKLVGHFRSLLERGLLQATFERIEGDEGILKLADPVPLLTAMCDVGDNLPNVQGGFGNLPMNIFIIWRTRAIVEKVEDPQRRLDLLKTVILDSTGLLGPIRIADAQQRPKESDGRERKYLVDENGAAELAQLAVGKIRTAARDRSLLTNEALSYVLYLWQEWAGPDEAKAWTNEILADEANVGRFLAGFVSEGSSQTVGSYYRKRQKHMSLKSLEKFTDVATVTRAVERLGKRKLSAQEKTAVVTYKRSIERRRKGHGEEPVFTSDDDGE